MAAKFWANWSFTDSSSYLGFFIYALFVFSTFSIAGSEASIFFIYLISLWRFIRRKGLGYKHWLIWPTIIYMNLTVLSGYFNGYPGIDHLYSAQTNWRLLLPFVIATASTPVDSFTAFTSAATFFTEVLTVAASAASCTVADPKYPERVSVLALS